MIDLKFKTTLNKPANEVWKFIIDDFYVSDRWASGVKSCRKGTPDEPFDRICETESGVLMDTITKMDDTNHILEFSVKGLPFFVKNVVSTWTVQQISENQSTLTLGPKIQFKPGIGTIMQFPMKIIFKKLYPGIIHDLTTFIETGKPSESKVKALAKMK